MSRSSLQDRITDQFAGRGERAEIWRAFDRVLPTDRYLNLGYSPRYLPHLLGTSQRRLAMRAGRELADRLPATRAVPLLDVGCGRGGPTIALASRYGFDATGVDLVPANVATADANAGCATPGFVVGDAMALPFGDGVFDAAVAVDSFVYVPRKDVAFGELARVLGGDGLVVVADLVATTGLSPRERTALGAFASAWDMPPIPAVDAYRDTVREAGFAIVATVDIGANSIDRFRTWTGLYLAAVDHGGPLLDRLGAVLDLDPGPITAQVRTAHVALPVLRHVILVARC